MLAMFATGLLAGQGDRVGTISGRVHTSDPITGLSNYVIWVDAIKAGLLLPMSPGDEPEGLALYAPRVGHSGRHYGDISQRRSRVAQRVLDLRGEALQSRTLWAYHDPPGDLRQARCGGPVVQRSPGDGCHIVVAKNPYFAQTSSNGTCQIASVPAGRHRLRCWHEGVPMQEQDVEVPENGSVTVDSFTQK